MIEAGVHLCQLHEALGQQARAAEQRQRQSELAGHQRLAQSAVAARDGSAGCGELVCEVPRRGLQRGREGEEQSGRARHQQAEDQGRCPDRDLGPARDTEGHHRDQTGEAPVGKCEPCHGTQQHQRHAFGDELADHAATPGAHHLSDRNLATATDATRQQQVRDVRARDQDQQPAGRQQRQQRRSYVAHGVVEQRRDRDAAALPPCSARNRPAMVCISLRATATVVPARSRATTSQL